MANFAIAFQMLNEGCTISLPNMIDKDIVSIEKYYLVPSTEHSENQHPVLVANKIDGSVDIYKLSDDELFSNEWFIMTSDGTIIEVELVGEECPDELDSGENAQIIE